MISEIFCCSWGCFWGDRERLRFSFFFDFLVEFSVWVGVNVAVFVSFGMAFVFGRGCGLGSIVLSLRGSRVFLWFCLACSGFFFRGILGTLRSRRLFRVGLLRFLLGFRLGFGVVSVDGKRSLRGF